MPQALDWLLSLPRTHPDLRFDLLGGLLLASALGGAIGWEREVAGKPAGLRTNILICMAATLLTDLSVRVAAMAPLPADPGRIAAQIVTGVGFLGAGTIIQARGYVTGLTSAATLWFVAAIGMAVGFGALVEAVGATLLVLVTLIPLRRVEAALGDADRERREAAPRRRASDTAQ
jgi:putative Mg2+ transporter-C (MgtC) family protein